MNDRELTYDEATALGFDATGRDGDPRFPYHLSDVPPGKSSVRVDGCATCENHPPGTMMPSHFASSRCESGRRAHCSCNVCF